MNPTTRHLLPRFLLPIVFFLGMNIFCDDVLQTLRLVKISEGTEIVIDNQTEFNFKEIYFSPYIPSSTVTYNCLLGSIMAVESFKQSEPLSLTNLTFQGETANLLAWIVYVTTAVTKPQIYNTSSNVYVLTTATLNTTSTVATSSTSDTLPCKLCPFPPTPCPSTLPVDQSCTVETTLPTNIALAASPDLVSTIIAVRKDIRNTVTIQGIKQTQFQFDPPNPGTETTSTIASSADESTSESTS